MNTQCRYGIDFGTTNSSISIVETTKDGKKVSKVFPVDFRNQPHEIINSVVGFIGDEVKVGVEGLREMSGDDDNPIREIKIRLLNDEKDGKISAVPGKYYSDAMAAILKRLKEAADSAMENAQVKPSGVVMGLPCEVAGQESIKAAYCNALYKAGFYESLAEAKNDVIFLDEPCAVALYYGTNSMFQNKRTMIFDFGGGTLDLAIVDLKQQSLDDSNGNTAHKAISKTSLYEAGEWYTKLLFKDVLFPTYRDTHCDGSAWEEVKLFRKMGCTSQRADDIFDELKTKAGVCYDFIRLVEEAKVKLSFEEYYDFYFECDSVKNDGKVVFEKTRITRDRYEQVLGPRLENIEAEIKRLIRDTKKKDENFTEESIDSVILAGGSSSIPCVRKRLEELFPGKVTFAQRKEGLYYIDMMTCIAQGMAIQGYYDEPKKGIDNVTACDYGIWDAYKRERHIVIPKNTNFSETDVNLSRNGLPPATKYCVKVEQENQNVDAFMVDIYEGQDKIMTLCFDKSHHSGYYMIYFRIDPGKGILEVRVYDTVEHHWVDDVKFEDRIFSIQE